MLSEDLKKKKNKQTNKQTKGKYSISECGFLKEHFFFALYFTTSFAKFHFGSKLSVNLGLIRFVLILKLNFF